MPAFRAVANDAPDTAPHHLLHAELAPSMEITRFLTADCIRLGLVSGHLDQIDPELPEKEGRAALKAAVMEELTDLFEASGEIRNRTKFLKDFLHREGMGSTAIGPGIAFPHVRSMQPRKTVLIFARTREGVWFDALDGELTHLFFGITGPTYDDKEFLRFHKWITTAFAQESWLAEALLNADDEHEILKILGHL